MEYASSGKSSSLDSFLPSFLWPGGEKNICIYQESNSRHLYIKLNRRRLYPWSLRLAHQYIKRWLILVVTKVELRKDLYFFSFRKATKKTHNCENWFSSHLRFILRKFFLRLFPLRRSLLDGVVCVVVVVVVVDVVVVVCVIVIVDVVVVSEASLIREYLSS